MSCRKKNIISSRTSGKPTTEESAMRAGMIAVLILHISLVNGKIRIEPLPEYPIAKESVILSVTGIKGNIIFFKWFKGPKATTKYHIFTYTGGTLIVGEQYNSRVNAFSNGSLQIRDLQVEDRGKYIVKVQTNVQEDEDIDLQVYETVGKPVITASHSEIKENHFASLTCAAANADRIVWMKSRSEIIQVKNGNIVTHENGTIVFSNIKSSDEGKYECQAENLVSRSSSGVYTLSISREENEPIVTEPYGSTTATPYMTATSDSKHANFHESAIYKSAGVTAGIISGTVLGILLIVIVSFLFYKRCGLQRKKKRAGPPIDGPGQYAIYNNILDPATGLEPKDEPLYMCLEFASEGTYIELQK
ncbi:carcinoembryonic antigen-related cell adhesion molecule 21-like [Ranitomeya imitator]|uniref:carcinoembryonic antigen-related cell adhesion molecule 21-like n=1 Tax=Ranitomeya imitator TaxID=111125 RepID=UPI0037E8411E